MCKFIRAALVALLAFAALFYAAPQPCDPSPIAAEYNPLALPIL